MARMKELRESLLVAVGDRVAKYGFKSRKRDQSYYRTQNWGKEAFHLAFIPHADDFDITADIAIRFDALEELVQKDNKDVSEKVKKDMFSMGAELGNLVDRRQKRWTVRVAADVDRIADQIVEFFENIGIPYFDKYSSMAEALRVLSGEGPDSWIHSPIDEVRAKNAVGLAWLLKDETKLKELIKSKTKYLTDRKDFGLDSFQAFVESLQ